MGERPGHVVKVKDRRKGVETGGMELVAVGHRETAKGLEVLRFVSCLDGGETLIHHLAGAEGEERRGLDRSVHPIRGARRLEERDTR